MRSALSLLVISILFSCDPCTDCGPSQQALTVDFKFINRDSLKITSDSLEVLDTLIFFNDSLRIVNTEIADGAEGLDAKKQELEDLIDGYTDLRGIAGFRGYLNRTRKTINTLLGKLEDGELWISNVEFIELGYSDTYEDSMNLYTFPLSYSGNSTSYSIDIFDGDLHQVTLEYELQDVVDEDRNVVRSAIGISVSSSSFLENELTCEESICSDGFTQITFYY